MSTKMHSTQKVEKVDCGEREKNLAPKKKRFSATSVVVVATNHAQFNV